MAEFLASVEYSSKEEMTTAVEAGSVEFEGTALTVEERTSAPRRRPRQRAPRAVDQGPNAAIYVKGIPEGTTTEGIEAKFGAFGTITKTVNRSNRYAVFLHVCLCHLFPHI